MKKFVTLLFIIAFAFSLHAQRGVAFDFTPATNDSVVGAVTKYCTLSTAITGQYTGLIEVYLTSSVGADDSTWVTIEGSMNNSIWYPVDMGTPGVVGSGTLTNGSYAHYTIGAASGGLLFKPTFFIQPLYLRIKLQHYVANTSIVITRAKLYLKR